MPDLDSLKAIVRAFIENATFHLDTDYIGSCGYHCQYCEGYFDPDYKGEGWAKPHSPDCLVLQAEAVLNEENV